MDGSICITEVLLREGWLVLDEPVPTAPTSLAKVNIDWSKTRA
jgi:hypothetical protein